MLTILIKNPVLDYSLPFCQFSGSTLVSNLQIPSLEINDSTLSQRFVDIMCLKHLRDFFLFIQPVKKEFFYGKAIDDFCQLMLISKETSGNLAYLDTFSRFPEKLHG